MTILNVNLHKDHTERNGKWLVIAEKLHEAHQMKAYFTAVVLELGKKLKELSEDKSSKCGDFVFTRSLSRGGVDYGSIPQLSGVDLDAYRKESFERWKLTKI